MRLRFFSDASERQLEAAGASRHVEIEFDDHCVELDDAGLIELARQLGAVEDDEPTRSSSGVDALLDTEAFSHRSNASRMPGYAPPPVTTVFGVKRRSTRGQPV